MSEYIGGGELFDTIRKFPYKLVQLYVAELAVALGMDETHSLLHFALNNPLIKSNAHLFQTSCTTPALFIVI